MSDYFYSLEMLINQLSFDECWRDMDWFMIFQDKCAEENNQ